MGAYLEILDEVVEYSEAVWILGILDVGEGTDFRGLPVRISSVGR